MRLTTIVLLLFLLSAFAIGISLESSDFNNVNTAIDNASNLIQNITLTPEAYSNSKIDMNGIYLILEKYIQFIGVLVLEVMRIGIKFGFENPSYFSPEFIFSLVKLIIILVIVSLLIQPLFYLVIFIIMGFIWLKDKLNKKKKKNDRR